jgi:pilus assembly protein CpaE
MRAVVVSDYDAISGRIRQVLLRHGNECLASDQVGIDEAALHVVQVHPDLVVLALSPAPDRALAILRDLALLTPARALVVGPTGDSQLVLRALRGGATDYVDEAILEADLEAALGRLRAITSAQVELGRTIAVLSPSGGGGSSTVAVNVATVLAKEHKSCLLVDLKLEAGDLAALLHLNPTHTIAELCQNVAQMDRVMFERSLVRHASGVHLLAPPRAFADVAHVTAEGVHQALRLGQALFPYVVVDLDHSFREEQMQALQHAQMVLLLLRLDFTALRQTQRVLDYLQELNFDPERLRVIVNRYGQPKEIPAAKAEEALGIKIFHYVPDEPKTVNRANNSGIPVVLESPSAKVSRSLAKLAASINGQGR